MSVQSNTSNSQQNLIESNSLQSSEEEKPKVEKPSSSSQWTTDYNDFISALDYYSPTVPEAVIKYNLQKSGVAVVDPRIIKFVGLATDKFLSDIIREASEISKLRKSASKRKQVDGALELYDVERSLSKHQIHMRKRKFQSLAKAMASSPSITGQAGGQSASSSSAST